MNSISRRKNVCRLRNRNCTIRSDQLSFEPLENRRLLAGTWTPFTAPTSIGTMMLLTDGTVLAQGAGQTTAWYKLTPNANGNYANGTWTSVASMHQSRLYYGSNVLPDGRVYVLGGEYSSAGGWTNTGEIYDPQANTWTVTANFPQSQFGDGQTVLLPSGKVIAGYLSNVQTYLYNPANNTWAATGNKIHNDKNNEENWALLPDGDVLSYDIWASINTGIPQAQRYDFATGTWINAGTLPALLSTPAVGYELGGLLMLPDGRMFQIGGNSNTALFNPTTNTWTAGPTVPGGKGADDAPAAIMPDGKILFTVDTPLFNPPTKMMEYDYVAGTITDITSTLPSALQSKLAGIAAYRSRMLMLPTGQMLFAPDNFAGNTMYVYTSNGSPDASWRPAITAIANDGGNLYTLTGSQLTGRSAGASYGDDAEMDTNYPIVQLTATDGSGKVYYARSFGWTPGVATGSAIVTSRFELPAGLPEAVYDLRVVASGIASEPVSFSTLPVGTVVTGSITNLTDVWQTVTLSESFTDPIVIAGPMRFGDAAPATVRIRNVTSNSFEIQVNEWDYLDGPHGPETVNYLVMNRGVNVLDNGQVILADSTAATSTFSPYNFSSAFGALPVVLTTVASDNDPQAITARLNNVSTSGFSIRVQEEEANDGVHPVETINFIATLPGVGQSNGLNYEFGFAQNINQRGKFVAFNQAFSDPPNMLAAMQSYNSADPANVRLRRLTPTNFWPMIQEETSLDVEIGHPFEKIGFMAFSATNPIPPGDFILGPRGSGGGGLEGKFGDVAHSKLWPYTWTRQGDIILGSEGLGVTPSFLDPTLQIESTLPRALAPESQIRFVDEVFATLPVGGFGENLKSTSALYPVHKPIDDSFDERFDGNLYRLERAFFDEESTGKFGDEPVSSANLDADWTLQALSAAQLFE